MVQCEELCSGKKGALYYWQQVPNSKVMEWQSSKGNYEGSAASAPYSDCADGVNWSIEEKKKVVHNHMTTTDTSAWSFQSQSLTWHESFNWSGPPNLGQFFSPKAISPWITMIFIDCLIHHINVIVTCSIDFWSLSIVCHHVFCVAYRLDMHSLRFFSLSTWISPITVVQEIWYPQIYPCSDPSLRWRHYLGLFRWDYCSPGTLVQGKQ